MLLTMRIMLQECRERYHYDDADVNDNHDNDDYNNDDDGNDINDSGNSNNSICNTIIMII